MALPVGPAGVAPAAGASPDQNAQLRQAARQLEAVFVKLMFEEMSKTVPDAGLFPKAPGGDFYEQWFRGAVADQWTATGGIGLGDRIAASLGADGQASTLRAALRNATGQGAAHAALGVEGVGRVEHAGHAHAHAHGPSADETGSVRLPVAGRITSGFGHRTHPVTGRADHHRGIDIAAPIGTPVRLPFAGKVLEVSQDAALGRYVVVEHQNGYRSVFGHLSEVSARPGDTFREGDVVASSGNTGRSTGPHLHYGLYRHGRAVDPTPLLR